MSDDGMEDHERQIADAIYAAMMESMHESDRSAQAKRFRVGVSDLGYCSERLRRFLDRQVPDEVDMLPAFHGTWLGEGLEQAVKMARPDAIIQAEAPLTLQGEQGTYVIPGHPDIIFPEGILLDAKAPNGLEAARRDGMADQQKRFQRHAYGWAAWNFGLFDDDVAPEDILVGNVWIDRSARERGLLVKTEPLDPAVIDEATQWLDEVVYAWQHGEEARKEPAREVCRKTCGFFRECRAYDTDVQGLLTDPAVLAAVDMNLEATDLTRRAKNLKEEAKDILDGVAGSTGKHLVRWVNVPASTVSYQRRAYQKLSVTKAKDS